RGGSGAPPGVLFVSTSCIASVSVGVAGRPDRHPGRANAPGFRRSRPLITATGSTTRSGRADSVPGTRTPGRQDFDSMARTLSARRGPDVYTFFPDGRARPEQVDTSPRVTMKRTTSAPPRPARRRRLPAVGRQPGIPDTLVEVDSGAHAPRPAG